MKWWTHGQGVKILYPPPPPKLWGSGELNVSYLVNKSQNEQKHAPEGREKPWKDAEAVTPREVIHPGAWHPVTVVAHLRKY